MQAELRLDASYFLVVGSLVGLCKTQAHVRERERRFALVDVSKGGVSPKRKRRRVASFFHNCPIYFFCRLGLLPSLLLLLPPPPPHSNMPPLNSLPSMVISKPREGGDDPFAAEPRQGAISYREAGEFCSVSSSLTRIE